MNQAFGKYIIRDWRRDDASSIAKYANNRNIWLNLRDAFPHPYTAADAEAFLYKAMRNAPRTFFAIATETEAIGSIALMPGQDVHRFTAEMGYWLGEPFWGKGIMTEAVWVMSEYALEELGFHRIFAEPYISNPVSARVLEKAGFIFEGILRASAVKDGRVLDQILYAKINDNAVISRVSPHSIIRASKRRDDHFSLMLADIDSVLTSSVRECEGSLSRS